MLSLSRRRQAQSLSLLSAKFFFLNSIVSSLIDCQRLSTQKDVSRFRLWPSLSRRLLLHTCEEEAV